MRRCDICGNEMPEGDFICPKCGCVIAKNAIADYINDPEVRETLKWYYQWESLNVIFKWLNTACRIFGLGTILALLALAFTSHTSFINLQVIIVLSFFIVFIGLTQWFCNHMACAYWGDLLEIQYERQKH